MWKDIIQDLIDNDTLIIFGVIGLAFYSGADVASTVVGGLLGYMRGRVEKNGSAVSVPPATP